MYVTCTCDNPVVDIENLTMDILSKKESGWQGGPEHAGAFFSVETSSLGHRIRIPSGRRPKGLAYATSERHWSLPSEPPLPGMGGSWGGVLQDNSFHES